MGVRSRFARSGKSGTSPAKIRSTKTDVSRMPSWVPYGNQTEGRALRNLSAVCPACPSRSRRSEDSPTRISGQVAEKERTGSSDLTPWIPPPPARDSLHLQAAVDGVDRAGDVAGPVLEQEFHHPRYLTRLAEAPHRYGVDDLVQDLLGDRSDHFRLDETRCDAVDGDSLARRFQGDALGEAKKP